MGDIISLDRNQSILMTYYRNNIIHLLALPSLIAQILIRQQQMSVEAIQHNVAQVYPFLKQELFLSYQEEELGQVVEHYLAELEAQQMISQQDGVVTINQAQTQVLMLLGRTILETLQRYAIALNLLVANPDLDKTDLESKSQEIAQRLGRLHGINAPEFFDKGVFTALFVTLTQQGYLESDGHCHLEQTEQFAQALYAMLYPEVRLTIQESIYQVEW